MGIAYKQAPHARTRHAVAATTRATYHARSGEAIVTVRT